jgi:hypothetical protein
MPEQGFFFDSSGIVKRYANEIGTDWVRSITTLDADNSIVISKITAVEVAAALARKLRLEEIGQSEYEMVITDFEEDCLTQYIRVEVNDEVINLARDLVARRVLRAYDAIQLASAIILNRDRKKAKLDPLVFVSADDSLNSAAEPEGLKVDNPNFHV